MELLVAIAVAFVGLALGCCLGLIVFLLTRLSTAVEQFKELTHRIAETVAAQGKTWDETATMMQTGLATLRVIQNSAEVQATQRRYVKPSRFRGRDEAEELAPWTSPMDEEAPPREPEPGMEP